MLELLPKGAVNKAPTNQAPVDKTTKSLTDETVNTFNANIGGAFKCSVCGAKHRNDNKAVIITCIRHGLKKTKVEDFNFNSYPYRISFDASTWGGLYITISPNIKDNFLKDFLKIDSQRSFFDRVDLNRNIMKICLAKPSFNDSLKEAVFLLPEYKSIMDNIKGKIDVVKRNDYSILRVWEELKYLPNRNKNGDDGNGNTLTHLTGYNNPLVASSYGYNLNKDYSCRDYNGDFYLLVFDKGYDEKHKISDKIFIRISLLYRYLPKYGIWNGKTIDDLMKMYPEDTWEKCEQIFFPEKIGKDVDTNPSKPEF